MTHHPHRIRLRGPWECEPLARFITRADGRVETEIEGLPPPCRMTMPGPWSEGGLRDFAGRVRFRRRFGYPGRLDAGERVWLTFAGAEGKVEVWLNGDWLGQRESGAGPFEFEVTPRLKPRNELTVEVESRSLQGGLWGEVAMEIRRTAFLRGVRVRATPAGLDVSGTVVGTADAPLELYVLLGGSTVHYSLVEAEPAGRPFRVRIEGPPNGPAAVRVELIQGGSVWYTVDKPAELSG